MMRSNDLLEEDHYQQQQQQQHQQQEGYDVPLMNDDEEMNDQQPLPSHFITKMPQLYGRFLSLSSRMTISGSQGGGENDNSLNTITIPVTPTLHDQHTPSLNATNTTISSTLHPIITAYHNNSNSNNYNNNNSSYTSSHQHHQTQVLTQSCSVNKSSAS